MMDGKGDWLGGEGRGGGRVRVAEGAERREGSADIGYLTKKGRVGERGSGGGG